MHRGACGHLLDGRVHRWQRSQADQISHAPQKSDNVKLALLPVHDSGVSGTASFEDTAWRVVVKLEVRGLPKPNTFYLAHIHPGTCAEGEDYEHGGSHGEEGYGHDHRSSGHEHDAEIEYPLSQVKSDAEGRGSSTTTLRETSWISCFRENATTSTSTRRV